MDVPRAGIVRNVCAVRCCARTYLHPNVRLFRFPKDPERCKKWAAACNQMVLYRYAYKAGSCLANSYYRVCNRHFVDSDYNDINKKRLHSCAVPSLNLTKEEIQKNTESNSALTSTEDARRQFEFIDVEDVKSNYGSSVDSPCNDPKSNEKSCQTQSTWAVSEATQTDAIVKKVSSATQTGLQLLMRAPRYEELGKKVRFLMRKVKTLERKLDIETKKHKAKHEMLVEILQKR